MVVSPCCHLAATYDRERVCVLAVRGCGMKLGLQLGYWGAQPPTDAARADARGGAARLRHRVHRRGLGLRRLRAAGLVGLAAPRPSASARRSCRSRPARPTAVRDARAHPRPPLAAAGSCSASGCRARRWSRAGTAAPFGKPLARTREYVDIVRQVLAREAPVTSAGPALPAALRRPGRARARQAAEADHPPAAGRPPDLAGRRGPEERRPGRRDRRRLAADLLLAEGRPTCTTAGSPRASPRPGARPTRPTSRSPPTARWWSPTTSTPPSTPCARASASTSAAWAPEDMNFHKQVFARMGYEAEAEQIQDLFLDGPARRGHRRRPAVAGGRHLPRRLPRADPRRAGGVGGGRGDDAGRRRRQRRPAPPHRRGRPRRVRSRAAR